MKSKNIMIKDLQNLSHLNLLVMKIIKKLTIFFSKTFLPYDKKFSFEFLGSKYDDESFTNKDIRYLGWSKKQILFRAQNHKYSSF